MARLGPRDRIDLSIALKEREVDFFRAAHQELEHSGGILEHQLSFSGAYLHVNAVDLISLLSYADQEFLSELELRSVEKKCMLALSALELNCTSPSSRAHYIWCKTALKSFPWGRNRTGTEENDAEEES
jgi:hypothetical protein